MLPLVRHPVLILSLAVLAITAMAVRSAVTFSEVSSLRSGVSQSTLRLLATDALWSSVQDAESGQRGYLLTGEQAYIKPYESALRHVDAERSRLRELYADDAGRMVQISEIDDYVVQKLGELAATLSLYRDYGIDEALAMVRAGPGRETMDSLRSAIEQLREAERVTLEVHAGSVAQKVDAAGRQTAGTVAGAIALTLFALWLQGRETRARELAQHGEREAMAALREANMEMEREHRRFLQALTEVPFEHDIASGTLNAAAELHALIGVHPGELKRIEDFAARVHPEDAQRATTTIGQAIAARRMLEMEYRLRHADGSYRWISARAVPQTDDAGHVVRMIGTMRDVTPLHEARSQLEVAVWASGIALWVVDPGSDKVIASPSWAAQLGHAVADLPSTLTAWGVLIHPDDRPRAQAHMAAVLDRSLDRYDIELRLRHRDGHYLWFLSRGLPRMDAGGAVVQVVGAGVDITAARTSQIALEQSRARLRSYAIALDHALELERTHIAREIHDELGQSMTSLKLDVGWIARRLDALDASPEVRAPLRARLDEMQSFLDTSIGTVRRIASELRPPLLDGAGIGAALEAQAEAFCRRAGLQLDLHVGRDLPIAGETATALFRIAQEAFTNIARHAGASRVEVRLAVADGRAHMDIIDNGRGIRAQLAADGAPTDMRAGFGVLGIEERARLAGGRAIVEAAAGGGTRVHAELPIAPPKPDALAQVAA